MSSTLYRIVEISPSTLPNRKHDNVTEPPPPLLGDLTPEEEAALIALADNPRGTVELTLAKMTPLLHDDDDVLG